MSLRAWGKRKAVENEVQLRDEEGGSTPEPVLKKSKKAITRPCPVCEENIPIRLLHSHLDLERARVEEIIQSIGKTTIDPSVLPHLLAEKEAGPSRRAAIKARQSLSFAVTTNSTSSSRTTGTYAYNTSTIQQDKTDIQAAQAIKQAIKNRKQRFAKLKDLAKDLTDDPLHASRDGISVRSTICPVCSSEIEGGTNQEVMEQHVDACIIDASRAERSRRDWEESATMQEYDIGGETRIRVTDMAGFRGAGFDVRNTSHVDVDEDIDIDGGDETLFGDAQFTERDVIGPSRDEGDDVDVGVDIGDDGSPPHQRNLLRELVAGPNVVNGIKQPEDAQTIGVALEDAEKKISLARESGNMHALVTALEEKIACLTESRPNGSAVPSTLTCRICLDPYKDPTVSTGCWHTCCQACWLRCLGSTKLCPICKRITGVSELRRIYL